MSDIIDINVNKIVETIDIVANFEHPNIEITAIENVDNVEINATPNVVQININTISGGSAEWGEIEGNLSDQTDLQGALDLKADISDLSAVAFSNDYNDLNNKPTIPTNTSDLINDGEDGVNPFITLADIPPVEGFVPYTGATQDVDLGEFELKAGQVEFDTTPTGTAGVGVMRWNDSDGTLDLGLKGGNVTLQLGQEQLVRAVNKTTTNITLLESNYQAVRVTGAQGQRLKVDLALATNDLLSAETIGLVTETIANNQEGFITISGLVRNINTTGSLQGETWVDGDILYLSPSIAGRITNIKPTAPNHLVVIGYVVYAHANNGKIFVKVNNGYELEELHNVSSTNYTTPIDTDSVLTYDVNNSLWKRLSWSNIKSNLKTYFDTIYTTSSAVATQISTALVGYATESWVTSQGYITNVITALGFTPENVANKSTSTSLGTSDVLYPTQNAVKAYADTKVDKNTTTGVDRVWTYNANGIGDFKPISELNAKTDTHEYWFSYTASHVTSAILYTQVANAILATSGTQSLITRVGTTLYNSYHFLNWVSATANGSNAGVKNNNNSDVPYRAGVEAYIIFGNNSDNVNHVTAVGSYSLLSAIPNLEIANFTTDFVGVGNDSGDTNLSFYCKRQDSPASYIKVPTNSNFPAHTLGSDIYMLKFETNRVSVQADFQIKLTLTNLINGAFISHTFTGLECPALNKPFINTVNRSNRNTGVATAIRWIKTHIKAKYF